MFPLELFLYNILPCLTYKDLAQLCLTNQKVRNLVLNVYCKQLCYSKHVSELLLRNSNMNPLELLDFWENSKTELSCGTSIGAMIDKHQRVLIWKEGTSRTVIDFPSEKFQSVSCGYTHTLVLTTQGVCYSFGKNTKGELGCGDFLERNSLTKVLNLNEPIEQAVGGENCSLFLTKSKKLFYCGDLEIDVKDQQEQQRRFFASTPKEISLKNLGNGEIIVKIALGAKHFIVLTNKNRLFSAGEKYLGRISGSNRQLGIVPTIKDLSIVNISAGNSHSLILYSDGSVYSFGKSCCGELGLSRYSDSIFPTLIQNLPPAISISAGHHHSLVLCGENQIFSFGMSASGQLGYRSSFWSTTVPSRALSFRVNGKIRNIVAGDGFSLCSTLSKNEMFACGKSSLCAGAGGNIDSQNITQFTCIPTI